MSGFRDWQDDGAPTIVVLWDKTPLARRPHLCNCCNEEIAPGTRYHSAGWREDGEFKTEKTHRWAYHYPSGCPRFADRDRREIEADFPTSSEPVSGRSNRGSVRALSVHDEHPPIPRKTEGGVDE